jgi:GT2 family glycosyltransferase
MKIVVIVVTYNGAPWIGKCLGSLLDSTIPIEILAIDNASADATVPIIKEFFPGIQLIETGSNLGFGKANNLGLKIAVKENADYVFLLNQDAWIEKDSIQKLVEVAEKNKQYGVISPFHMLPGNEKIEWHFSVFISPEKCADLYSDIYVGQKKEIYGLPFVNAAAWLISKECLYKVGGFDPLFPHYGEDDDYCNRVLKKGLLIGVAPAAIIYHDITCKSWEEIKFSFTRQLISAFIDLKNIRHSFRYSILNYCKTRKERITYLLIFRKWKEMFFMIRVLFRSFKYFPAIYASRKIAREDLSYLK